MANEFFAAFGPEVAITITPKGLGILQVFVDGEKVYDRLAEGGKYPDLPRVLEMKVRIEEKIDAVTASADG